MRIGYIDYLNSYPLYWRIFEAPSCLPGVEVVRGTPAELNQAVRAGKLALSPVSVACLPDIQDDVQILSEFCLGAYGHVRSVLLLSRRPIEELDDCTITLPAASETSVVLLRYLLECCYGHRPRYRQVGQQGGANRSPTAALLIGNDALMADTSAYAFVYDLAALWQEKTGLPMVFAVFVARNDALRREPETISRIRSSLSKSLEEARENKATFIAKAAKAYPSVTTDLGLYFESMKYELTPPFKKALRTYLDRVHEAGLLPELREISYV